MIDGPMDDGNGAEYADWLMSGRMAFCRAYPGQIALIISALHNQDDDEEMRTRWPQQLQPKASARRIFIKLAFLKSPCVRIIRAR